MKKKIIIITAVGGFTVANKNNSSFPSKEKILELCLKEASCTHYRRYSCITRKLLMGGWNSMEISIHSFHECKPDHKRYLKFTPPPKKQKIQEQKFSTSLHPYVCEYIYMCTHIFPLFSVNINKV